MAGKEDDSDLKDVEKVTIQEPYDYNQLDDVAIKVEPDSKVWFSEYNQDVADQDPLNITDTKDSKLDVFLVTNNLYADDDEAFNTPSCDSLQNELQDALSLALFDFDYPRFEFIKLEGASSNISTGTAAAPTKADNVLASAELPLATASSYDNQSRDLRRTSQILKKPATASIFTCNTCEFTATKKKNLTTHILNHGGRQRRFKCKECGLECQLESVLIEHVKSVHPKTYTCKRCNNHYDKAIKLKAHKKIHIMQKKCVKLKEHSCRLCAFTTVRRSDMKSHAMTHMLEKRFTCHLCSFNCKFESNLDKHLKTHTSERSFACKHCRFTSATSRDLENHLKIHTNNFVCKNCSFKCSSRYHLEMHYLAHTGQKPFVCVHCTYTCSKSSDLKIHHTKHTGEKRFACVMCSYKCHQSFRLKIHLKSHNGVSFACQHCSYKCITKSRLKEHLMTHTDEKPF